MELLSKLRAKNLTRVMEGLIEPWGEDIDKATRLNAKFAAGISLILSLSSLLIIFVLLPLQISFDRGYTGNTPSDVYHDPVFWIGLSTNIGFFAAYYWSRKTLVTRAVTMMILVFLITPLASILTTHNRINFSFLVYQMVAISIAGMFLGWRSQIALFLVIIGLDMGLSLVSPTTLKLFETLIVVPLFFVVSLFALTTSIYRDTLEKVRQEELRDTVMMERNRIAEELHDAAVQSITGARRLAETIRKRVKTSDDDKLKEYVEATITAIGSAELEMRSMLGELRPDYLIRETLPALLQSWISLASLWSKGQIRLTIEADEQDVAVSNEKKVAIYRVIQEATSNAIRHANAKTIEVLLQAEDRHLRITVRDDGVGFDARANKKIGGTGNMERRIREAGGIFTLSSGSQGTEILFVV